MALTWWEREAFRTIVEDLRAEDPTLWLNLDPGQRAGWVRRGWAACGVAVLLLAAGGYFYARQVGVSGRRFGDAAGETETETQTRTRTRTRTQSRGAGVGGVPRPSGTDPHGARPGRESR